jgi:hypothetical protein
MAGLPRAGLDEKVWNILLSRIQTGNCTPFLGAGINSGILPLGSDIAKKWAAECRYPLKDCDNLERVAQYLALQYDAMYPKDQILDVLEHCTLPDFKSDDARLEALKAIAELPFRIYLTTNYDGLLLDALTIHAEKSPYREFCRWNEDLKGRSALSHPRRGPEISAKCPLVFHLHGNNQDRHSIVLTEDDYLDFLVEISQNERLLPTIVQGALGGTLLFIGYSLSDISFKVLYRWRRSSLKGSADSISVAVQLDPGEELKDPDHPLAAEDLKAIKGYREKYFEGKRVEIYWGTANDFARELRNRWNQWSKDHGNHALSATAVH